jgi:ADP-ribosylglycohydrolase
VAGGLSGLFYGTESLPADWLDALARKTDIEELVLRFSTAAASSNPENFA